GSNRDSFRRPFLPRPNRAPDAPYIGSPENGLPEPVLAVLSEAQFGQNRVQLRDSQHLANSQEVWVLLLVLSAEIIAIGEEDQVRDGVRVGAVDVAGDLIDPLPLFDRVGIAAPRFSQPEAVDFARVCAGVRAVNVGAEDSQ